MPADWTEKYRPQTLADIVGNPGAAAALKQWAESWNQGIPEKRAVLIIGSPGIGKTSSAEALARDMGWSIVEMNASDQRTGDAIREVAQRAAITNTFSADGEYHPATKGGRNLIVLDEADSLYGNADRGALPAINDLVKNAQQPVVLIVNDSYDLLHKSAAIKSGTLQITFRKPTAKAVEGALGRIAKAENVPVEPGALAKIAANADGDLRAAIRDLESLAHGQPAVSAAAADQLSSREDRNDMYDLMGAVFRHRDPAQALQILRRADTDPGTIELWLDENYPYEMPETGDLVRGAERMAKIDLCLGWVTRRMNYGFWSYANQMMTYGMIDARHSDRVSYERFRFPSYLMQMSRSKAVRGVRNSAGLKLGVWLHTASQAMQSEELPYLQLLARQNPTLRVTMIREAGLEPEELGFLLGEKMDSPIVKEAFAAAEAQAEAERLARLPPRPAAPATAEEPAPKKRRTTKTPAEPPAPAAETAPTPAPAAPAPTVSATPLTPKAPAPPTAPAEAPAPAEPAPVKKTQRSLFDF